MIRDDDWRKRRRVANALLAGGMMLCAVLLLWPPGRSSCYPSCPIHQYLGIECPGCGATRALAALLHGQLREAMRLNALFVLLLPCAMAGAIKSYRRALLPGEFRWPRVNSGLLYAGLAVAAVFAVARNLP